MDAKDWNAEAYAENSSAQESWGTQLHGKLDLHGDETIVDIGCGDGRLTARLAARVPRGRVVGLDSSPSMVEHARTAWSGIGNLEFRQADARSFHLESTVDALVSNAVLHWLEDLGPVFDSCRDALKPRGRILFQMGGIGNIAELESAAAKVLRRDPWNRWFDGLPPVWHMHSPEEARSGLEAVGLVCNRAEILEKDMVHSNPEAMLAWMRATWFSAVAPAPEDRREDLLVAIRDAYLEDCPPDAQGRTHVRMARLEVAASAPE